MIRAVLQEDSFVGMNRCGRHEGDSCCCQSGRRESLDIPNLEDVTLRGMGNSSEVSGLESGENGDAMNRNMEEMGMSLT